MTRRLLVLGGTQFVGRHVVDLALRRGDDVTTLNRGTSAPDHPDVTAIHGDRADDAVLAAVAAAGPYDLVVDTCGFVPRVVLQAARRLEPVAGRYLFVSSISVHPEPFDAPVTEASPVSACPPDAGPDAADYGVLKAGCENAVTATFADRAVVVRPGVILGPHENVGRLVWWLQRMARGGDVVAPGTPDRAFQALDGRDLAAFCLGLQAGDGAGPFDVTGPPGRYTWGDFLALVAETTGAGARLVWAGDAVLAQAGVAPWTGLPLWLPAVPEVAHFFDVRPDRAVTAGFAARPLADTVGDTWAWLQSLSQPPVATRANGIDQATEDAILAALR